MSLYSCNKDNNEGSDSYHKNYYYRVDNGILNFSDSSKLLRYANYVNGMSYEDLTSFENEIGFVSQKRIFDDIAFKEYQLQIVPFQNKTEEEMKNIPFPGHCAEYVDALNSGVIVEIEDKEGKYIDYNIEDSYYAAVLNKDGFVTIGENTYLYKGNTITCIKGNHEGEIEELEGVTVGNRSNTVEDAWYNINGTSNWVYSGSKFRARVDVTSKIRALGLGTGAAYAKKMHCYPFVIKTNAQKKNFWGIWNQYWGAEYINGSCTIELDWSQDWFGPYYSSNGLNNTFLINHYFPSASNATLKYNIITGQHSPNLEYTIVTAPYNGYYLFRHQSIKFNITADLPGGPSGITCEANIIDESIGGY